MQVLALHELGKSYNGNKVLHNVTTSLRTGEVHALVGHNGAGKSTLLKILSGVEWPDEGEIQISGRSVRFRSPYDAQAEGIACVYQELRVINQLSVAENLFLGTTAGRGGLTRRTRIHREAKEIIGRYGLALDPGASVATLSHAEKQLLEIVAALQKQSTFLFLDEPTTSLEFHQVDMLLTTIRNIVRNSDTGVVLVTHKLNEVFAVADRVTVLSEGRVVLSGDTSSFERDQIVRSVVGHKGSISTEPETPIRRGQQGDAHDRSPVMSVRNLVNSHLRGVTLDVYAGEVLGLYGLVGAGRTEFLRTVMGLDKILSGELWFLGHPFHPRRPQDALKRGITYVTEDRRIDGFIPNMNSIQNAALPIYARESRFGFVARRMIQDLAAKQFSVLQIRGDVERAMRYLSGGNQQKILFARAALQNPMLLLLDEPTKGIDLGVKSEIYAIIRSWVREQSTAVIVASTEEEEIIRISDRIGVFVDGRCAHIFANCQDVTAAHLRTLAVGGEDFRYATVTE